MKSGNWFWAGLGATAITVSGCGVFGDSYSVYFQTESDQYEASTSTTISMAIENTGDNVVYYRCSGDMYIEQFADDELDESFGALPSCSSLDANPIESGDTWAGDLTLDEDVLKWLFENSDVPDGVETTYRLRFELFEDTEFANELPLDEERSNPFTITFPAQ